MSIGTRIIQIRNERNLTQRQLSERSGIASSYISRVENRRIEPGPKTLRRIADGLGVPLSQLFQEPSEALDASQCAITVSGNCIMDLLRSGRGKAARSGAESYTPQQLQLLRIANFLIQSGDGRTLDALDLLLNSLLRAEAGARGENARRENSGSGADAQRRSAGRV